MTFTSLTFLVFIFIVFISYYLVSKRKQWIVLLLASYIFYLTLSFKLSIFLSFTTITTFLAAKKIYQIQEEKAISDSTNKDDRRLILKEAKNQSKKILAITLVLNFGILAFLKYYSFFFGNINNLLDLFGIHAPIPKINLILPLGISFYTFQTAGYLIDVYRNKIKPDNNLFKYSLFVSFFPQIIQGPISRYNQLAEQLYSGSVFDYREAKFGIQLMLWGFFKKMVIADRAGLLVNTVFNQYYNYEGAFYLVAVIFYCIQIYGDFSGGIDIARGISQVLGIDMVENFKRPYFAKSVSEFWQRWHITLGTWMKDYIFYPLALSRTFGRLGKFARKKFGHFIGKQLPAGIASLIVFIIVGIWHGSSWKFVAFGLYHGFFILSSSMLAPVYTKSIDKLKIDTQTYAWKFFQILRTFSITAIGRFFSRGLGFKISLKMMISSFRDFNPWIFWDGSLLNLGIDLPNLILLMASLLVLFTVSLFQERGFSIRGIIAKQNILFRWTIYFIAIFSILVFGIYGPGFEEVDFIYQGF